MDEFRKLRVLHLAEMVDDEITSIALKLGKRFLHKSQTLRAVHSIPSNIREAYRRKTREDRNYKLVVAAGEAEETIGHLRSNMAANRIPRPLFWKLRGRLVLIGDMLDGLMECD